jgi:hypothetical protein
LSRATPGDLRIASFNVSFDGLFDTDPDRQAAFGRIIQAIDADVWILNEVVATQPSVIEAKFEELLPAGPESAWSARKFESEWTAIVSRFPVLESAEFVVPGRHHLAVRSWWSAITGAAAPVMEPARPRPTGSSVTWARCARGRS